MIQILVTGANGQLGSEIQKLSVNFPDWRFYFTDVDSLDIVDRNALRNFFTGKKIDYIINCAAYTAVDKAESDIENATRINRDAVKNLANVASEFNCKLIHISTDYVFDGNAFQPYTESLSVNPQSAYGRTKYAGEQEALKLPDSIIIRTSWLYSAYGNNFVKTMLRIGKERSELNVVSDQVGTPTYAEDLAIVILKIINFTEAEGIKPGIYHFSNEGVCSWYDFALEILEFSKSNCKVIPIESKDYPTPTKRPFYSVLNKNKIKMTFTIEIPHWKTSLYKCLFELTK